MFMSERKQLLSIIDTLYNLHKKFRNNKSHYSFEILEACQQSAINVGECIEKSEKYDKKIVELLEWYCEIVYQLFETRHEKSVLLTDEAIECLEQVRKLILETKIKVLFLPYKASMWDSLESIWEEAVRDTQCEITVVAIPYYDKNPDGSFSAMYYEGKNFPANVKITDWKEYDGNMEKPDIVFIHNPYDDNNYVTSVHPKFYSTSIRSWTECLVYVPYFVSHGEMPIELCHTPACVMSDFVIVQSESIKDIYVEEYKKILKEIEQEPDEGFENKFLPWGTPKLDKVMKAKREDYSLCEEWNNKIQDNKIFLYNPHLNYLIQDGRSTIDKMRQVFDLFSKRRDAILWWRPHPLSKSTLKAMNQQSYEEYIQLVEWFQREKIGIYDESPEVNRAMAYADAYIGDMSSLITLVGVLGKPIMRQNYDVCNESKELVYDIWDCFVRKGNHLWFMERRKSGIYHMNLNTQKVQKIADLPSGENNQLFLYRTMVMWNEKIVFVPYNAEDIVIYDINTKVIHKLTEKTETQYMMAFSFDKWVYMFATRGGEVLKLNMETFEVEYLNFAEKLVTFVSDETQNWIWNQFYQYEDKVYFPLIQTNIIGVFDLQSESITTMEVGKKGETYHTLCGINEHLCVTERSNGHIQWLNCKTGEILYEKWLDMKEPMECTHSFSCGNAAVIIMRLAHQFILMDENGNMQFFEVPHSDYSKDSIPAFYFGATDENQIVFFNNYGKKNYLFDMEKKNFTNVQVGVDYSNYEEYWRNPVFLKAHHFDEVMKGTRYIYMEKNVWDMEKFINAVIKGELTISAQQIQGYLGRENNVDGSAGKHIWNGMKKYIL